MGGVYTPKESYLFSDLSDHSLLFFQILFLLVGLSWKSNFIPISLRVLEGSPFTTVMVNKRQAWYVRACSSSAFTGIS